MADKGLKEAVGMLETFAVVLEMVKRQDVIRKELDSLEIVRSDKQIKVDKEGRQLDREHEKKKGELDVKIEVLEQQNVSLSGDNEGLRDQIESNKQDITGYDETIEGLKKDITGLREQKKEVSRDLLILTGKVDKIQTTLKG